jgi:hypothetical protein
METEPSKESKRLEQPTANLQIYHLLCFCIGLGREVAGKANA